MGVQSNQGSHLDSLIGVFVPQSRVQEAGFSALDGTKGVVPVGIMPSGLFLIGTGKTFSVSEAGTLFLGINDCCVSTNGGASMSRSPGLKAGTYVQVEVTENLTIDS